MHYIPHLIAASLAHTLLVPFAILLGTFLFEDVTVIIVAILASDGLISLPLALLSLYVSIVFCDLTLYWLGRLAVLHPWARRIVEHERVTALQPWFTKRSASIIFMIRCLPGVRIPGYLACGFFGVSFDEFLSAVLVIATFWVLALFTLAYAFGAATGQWLGHWRWIIALIPILIAIVTTHSKLFRRKTIV